MSTTSGRQIRIEAFNYDLPDDRIARHPLPQRDAAKLLHYKDGKITDHHFHGLPALLPPGTLLIGNATRVIHARLHFELPNGRQIEIFCLDPLEPADYQQSFSHTKTVTWKCLVGGNRRWKDGIIAQLPVSIDDKIIVLKAQRIGRLDNTFSIQFSWEGDIAFGPLLDAAGNIPLPPYLGRAVEETDKERYQTIFAQTEGSVAAPTAGLHLSEPLMDKLKQQNLNWGEVVLHVGAGTFKPVSADTLEGHEMHQEYFEVDRQFLERLQAQLKSEQAIVSIGTTTTRCLESLYYLGSLLHQGKLQGLEAPIQINQWIAIDHLHKCSSLEAISCLIDQMKKQQLYSISGSTQLIITPDVSLKVADGLITNFHQPNSTLLLIVAAVVGASKWQVIYEHALANEYRFLSYGDGSLLWKRK